MPVVVHHAAGATPRPPEADGGGCAIPPTFTPPPPGGRGPRPGRPAIGARAKRRLLSALSLLLVIAAAAVFAYPVFTDVVAHRRQASLNSDFTSPQWQRAYRMHAIKVGQGLTRLRIPKLGVDVLVVEGATPAALEAGAGHYPATPLPGERGNVAIAGHRTTYGRPFNRLDELAPGDRVLLDTPLGEYVYRAVDPFDGHANPWVVGPDDFSVVRQDLPGQWLTLTTCHPKGSDRHRLVLRLRLVSAKSLPASGTDGTSA